MSRQVKSYRGFDLCFILASVTVLVVVVEVVEVTEVVVEGEEEGEGHNSEAMNEQNDVLS